jgi:nicotinamidase/pyrazinamidase
MALAGRGRERPDTDQGHRPKLGATDALLLVDVQNDFCPGGALPVAEGDRIVPVLNRWIDAAGRGGALIVASRDWHPAQHVSFHEQGGTWPAHCVQDTRGAAFHPHLELPEDVVVISKGRAPHKDNYSPFEDTDLATILRQRGIKRVLVGGLALDVCVRAAVLDALAAGYDVHLIENATRAVNVKPDDGRRTVQELRARGARIVSGEFDA